MKLTRERLAEMKAAKMAACDWRRDLFTITEGGTEADERKLSEYFSKFLPPGSRCPACLNEFAKGILGAFLGAADGMTSLEWGLAHGECFCIKCRYPFRALHYDVGPMKSLNVALPYHPDGLFFDDPETKEEE